MLNVHELKAQDLQRLSPGTLAEVAAQMRQHIAQQSKQIDSLAQAIKFRDVKIERITFELRRMSGGADGGDDGAGSALKVTGTNACA